MQPEQAAKDGIVPDAKPRARDLEYPTLNL